MILIGYSFFQTIPAHQSQRSYICKTFCADIPPATSVTKDVKTVTIATENVDFMDFTDTKPELIPILHKLQVDRDKVESLYVVGAKFRSFVTDEGGGKSVRNVLQIYERCDWCAGIV